MGASVVIAAAVRRAEREVVAYFRDANALSPDHDVPLLDADSHLVQARIDRLLSAQVIQRGARGGYWLDERMYAGYRSDKRTLVFVLLGIVLATGLGVLLAQRG